MPRMTNAVIQKRLSKLEAEVKKLRAVVERRPNFSIDDKNWNMMRPTLKKVRTQIYRDRYGKQQKKETKSKPLPKWLQASLKDIEAGRVSGPFDTVEELMADLNGPGK